MTVAESLLIAVLGGLFGAISTVTVQYLREWRLRPRLIVTWDRRDGGCVVLTPVVHATTLEPLGECRYLRLRIDNDGRATAKSACVSIVSIRRRVPGSGEDNFDEEVMDLTYPLARPTRATRADIPPKTHRFINLCHTSRMLDGTQEFAFDIEVNPIRMKVKYDNSAADYEVELMIAADNVTGRRVNAVPIRHGGAFDSLHFQ